MKSILLVIIAGTMLSGCMTNSYHPRAYGEDWKIYPYEEGSAKRAGQEGRNCWSEVNRMNWDQCY